MTTRYCKYCRSILRGAWFGIDDVFKTRASVITCPTCDAPGAQPEIAKLRDAKARMELGLELQDDA